MPRYAGGRGRPRGRCARPGYDRCRAQGREHRSAASPPGTITGAFALGYGIIRVFCELFREPDAQLGFLWQGLTMGMLLSLPLMLAGIAFLVVARRREPMRST